MVKLKNIQNIRPYIVIKHGMTVTHLVTCIECFAIDTAYVCPSFTPHISYIPSEKIRSLKRSVLAQLEKKPKNLLSSELVLFYIILFI